MNIIAGQKRGAKLAQLSGQNTRPTAQRTREAIFNLIMGGRFGRNLLHSEMVVLDLCAGTGALAFEALSRGAGHAVLVEQDKNACQVINQNIEKLGYQQQTTLLRQDVTTSLHYPQRPAALVFCDAPYDSGLSEIAISACLHPHIIAPDAMLIIETRKNEQVDLGQSCTVLDSRTYGMARISIFSQAAADYASK